jgi:hypothetical protein
MTYPFVRVTPARVSDSGDVLNLPPSKVSEDHNQPDDDSGLITMVEAHELLVSA